MPGQTKRSPRVLAGPNGPSSPVFRLSGSAHVGGVHLQVSDLRVSVDYYEQVIGLSVFDEASDSATLIVPGDDCPLMTLHTAAGVTRARRGSYGLCHFAIRLPDCSALGRFAAHVASQRQRIGLAHHLVSDALYLWDPDGLGIEVYVDRPRHLWRWRDGELVMTTDPLDLDHVIAAGDGVRWDGLPPGTTMGHVHFHVGNLRDAENFYAGGLGLEKTVWSYPGALFLSAGGYHHHLGLDIWSLGPAPAANEARLLEWELVVPSVDDINAVGRNLRSAGYVPEYADNGLSVPDPWGTRIRLRMERDARSRLDSSGHPDDLRAHVAH
jgi:catechol 2,3-dioxygenase